MKKVLFVDDEPAVLDGLEDMLHKHRRRWDMTFACGGDAAISEMTDTSYDVVVSDVRMPSVGGVDVLKYAKENCPNAIRIALTGFSDEGSTIKLTELAQRYLTKPCSVEDLDDAITRDSGLIEAFDNPRVQELAGSAGRLPADESIQSKLLACLNSSEGSVEEIAALVEDDLALTAKVLQLANSSFFRRQVSVVSARQAVTHLGIEVIRSLVLADQLFEKSNEVPKMDYFDIHAMHRHSQLCSLIAREIATSPEMATVAMTAGLLHDVGKLLVAIDKPELVASLVGAQEGPPYTWISVEREREILGCTHSEVGGYFLNLWGVPTPVVEAVTFHDTPSEIYVRELDAVGVVHISNYLAYWAVSKEPNTSVQGKLDEEFVNSIGMNDRLEEWKATAIKIAEELTP